MQTNVNILSKIRETMSASVIDGCVETLQQGQQFLLLITNEEYQLAAPPYVNSTIGEHFRHVLDMFNAVYTKKAVIDYNKRRRGNAVEKSRVTALEEIKMLITWLEGLDERQLGHDVMVSTEVCLNNTRLCDMSSTFERELSFVALHATHHYAMTKVIISSLNINKEADDKFGCAPATISYLREQ